MRSAQITIPPTRDDDWWVARAREAVQQYLAAEGAVVWVELQALLCETPWLRNNLYPSFPASWRVDPLHLKTAITQLGRMGALVVDRAVLGGHPIDAYIHVPSLAAYGRRTAVRDVAAAKRRLNRRLLQWTGTQALCGDVAESVLDATMRELAGRTLWLPGDHKIGRATSLLGRSIAVGGPLDSHGWWPRDLANPNAGFVPFAVEVKNIRGALYPWDHEVWDLLAKLGAFPDVLPILVARHIHKTTFNMFKDLGALGVAFNDQWFSPAIDTADFERVANGLHLHNAKIVDPASSSSVLSTFFSRTGPRVAGGFLERWATAAPLVASFTGLRDSGLQGRERRRLWLRFGSAVKDSGLYERASWASKYRASDFEDVDGEEDEERDRDEYGEDDEDF